MIYKCAASVGTIILLYTALFCESAAAVSLSRQRRQTQCPPGQWSCGGGAGNQCVDKYEVCDGRADCRDGADETAVACQNMQCPSYTFRCTYGACVSGNARCNGVQDCADNSDETAPGCSSPVTSAEDNCRRGEFQCASGQCVSRTAICDGAADCEDGSDETAEECSATQCPSYAFRCRYGACIAGTDKCDGVRNCYDGSDEDSRLCGTTSPTTAPIPVLPPITRPSGGSCVVPDAPGTNYMRPDREQVEKPGAILDNLSALTIRCDAGLHNTGDKLIFCVDGSWSPHSGCTKTCKISEFSTYDTRCKIGGELKKCPQEVAPGTVVEQFCKPEYKFQSQYTTATCKENGYLDYPLSPCVPICGLVVPHGVTFVVNGFDANTGEFPWHAAIYESKDGKPRNQICGGSIINAVTILSAAHCFYGRYEGVEQVLPKEKFSVAVGKIYRSWTEEERFAQFSELRDLLIPETYIGLLGNYADDIAILFLKTPITFNPNVRPVCVDWQPRPFSDDQATNEMGKVAGWGLTKSGGEVSSQLKWISLPRVTQQECREQSPNDFRPFLTRDKFCAGYLNGSSVCQGDSGGGLSFPEQQRSDILYYLKGIVSVGPSENDSCNSHKYTAFTSVQDHNSWLMNKNANRGLL